MTVERERQLEELLREMQEQQVRDTTRRERDLELRLRRQTQTPGENIMRMTGNYPGSALDYGVTTAKGYGHMLTSPLEVGREALTLGRAALEKGGRKFEEFVTGEEIPPSRPEVEAPAEQIGQYYSDKYGTLDRAVESFVQDPVGSAADVFPFLGQRFGVSAAGRAAGRNVAGRTSDRMYRRAAGIPRSMEGGLDLAREAARRGIDITEGGLKNTRAMRRIIGDDLEQLVANRIRTGGTGELDDLGIVPKQVILRHMDELIDSHRNSFDADTIVPFLKKEKVRLMTVFGDRNQIGLDDLQNYKTKTYTKAYKAEAAGPKPEVETLEPKIEAMRTTARAAKEYLEDVIPGYEKLNRKFEVFAKMTPYIKQRINNIPNDYTGRMIRATLDSPGWQSKAAIALRKIADNDYGWIEKNLNSPEIRTLMYLTGMHMQEPEPIPVWGGKQ